MDEIENPAPREISKIPDITTTLLELANEVQIHSSMCIWRSRIAKTINELSSSVTSSQTAAIQYLKLGYTYTCHKEGVAIADDLVTKGHVKGMIELGNKLHHLIDAKRERITTASWGNITGKNKEQNITDVRVCAFLRSAVPKKRRLNTNKQLIEWKKRHQFANERYYSHPGEIKHVLQLLDEQQRFLDFAHSLNISMQNIESWYNTEATREYGKLTAIGILELRVLCTVVQKHFTSCVQTDIYATPEIKQLLFQQICTVRKPYYNEKLGENGEEKIDLFQPAFVTELLHTAELCFPEYSKEAQLVLLQAFEHLLENSKKDDEGNITLSSFLVPLKKDQMNAEEKLLIFDEVETGANPYLISDTTDEILLMSSFQCIELLVECPIVPAWKNIILQKEYWHQTAALVQKIALAKGEKFAHLAVQICISILSLDPLLYPYYRDHATIEELMAAGIFSAKQSSQDAEKRSTSAQFFSLLPQPLQERIQGFLLKAKEQTVFELMREWFTEEPLQSSYLSGESQSLSVRLENWHWFFKPEEYFYSGDASNGIPVEKSAKKERTRPVGNEYLGHPPHSEIIDAIKFIAQHLEEPVMVIWYLQEFCKRVEWKFILLEYGWNHPQPSVIRAIEHLLSEDDFDTAFLSLFEGTAFHIFNRATLNAALPKEFQLPIDDSKIEATEVIVDYTWFSFLGDDGKEEILEIPQLWEPIAGIYKMFSRQKQIALANVIRGLRNPTIASELHKGNDEDIYILPQLVQSRQSEEDIPYIKAIFSLPNNQQHEVIASSLFSSSRKVQCAALEQFEPQDAARVACCLLATFSNKTSGTWEDLGICKKKSSGKLLLPHPYKWMNRPLNTHKNIKSIMYNLSISVSSPYVENFYIK